MAGDPGYFTLKSNDGQTTYLSEYSTESSNIRIDSTAIVAVVTKDSTTTLWTYEGSGDFLGLSNTLGSSTAEYPVGTTISPQRDDIYYIVEEGGGTLVNYRPLTYIDAKIQVDSAVRDGNGVKIDTNYQRKPQVIEYTVPTTISSGNIVIAEYNGTYDGSPGYVKFAMEVTSSSYKGIYVAEATWGLANGGITLISSNATNNDVAYLRLHYPSSTSNYAYPPVLSVYNVNTSEKQVKITVLEDSGNLTWKTDWGTTLSETGRTGRYVTLSNTSQVSNADNASTATAATYASYLNAVTVTTLPTSSGIRFCTNLTILSKTDTWFIETYARNPYIFQRATAMSDPSEVAMRTSTDNGSTWTSWTYSYAVWHT